MSTRDLVNAIVAGDSEAAQVAFESEMMSRIADRLDNMKQDVAQTMFKAEEVDLDEEATPTGIKIYHTDPSGNETWTKSPTAKMAAQHEKDLKKAGHKITHRAVMYGKEEGEKVAVKEEVEQDLELNLEDFTVEELEDFMVSEDFEQLDELSKATLGRYIKKAGQHRVQLAGKERDLEDTETNLGRAMFNAPNETRAALKAAGDAVVSDRRKVSDKSYQRAAGIRKAVDKLTK